MYISQYHYDDSDMPSWLYNENKLDSYPTPFVQDMFEYVVSDDFANEIKYSTGWWCPSKILWWTCPLIHYKI